MKSKNLSLFSSVLFVILTALTLTPASAVDMYIKWGTFPGESRDATFPAADGWNEVVSFGWNVSASTSWTAGGGASVGKPNPGSFSITKKVDSASPGMLSHIVTGKAAPTVELVVRDPARAGAKDGQLPYLRYEFTGAFITSISPSASSGDQAAYETVSFVFKTVKMTYRPVTSSGELGMPIVLSWDIPAGSATLQ